MALPPLELFSLRKELPCCRAALSVSKRHSAVFPSGSLNGIRPAAAAGLAGPAIAALDVLENWICGAAIRAGGHFICGNLCARLVDDVLRDWLRDDFARVVEVVGGDEDAPRPCGASAELFDPAVDSRAAQRFAKLPCLLLTFAFAKISLPCELAGAVFAVEPVCRQFRTALSAPAEEWVRRLCRTRFL